MKFNWPNTHWPMRVGMGARQWRAGACLCLAILGGLGMITWTASPASACSTGSHCYAEESSSGGPNHGAYGEIYIDCLYMPNNGNFANNEIWDSNDTGTYWTEAGVKSGVGYKGGYYNKQWFWADSRPNGGGYNEHEVGITAGTGTLYPTEITWLGNNSWAVYGGNSFTRIGTSTSQPVTSSGATLAGTEYTADASSGIRDIGGVYDIEWQNPNTSQWTSVGNSGSGFFNGYIGGVYNNSGSYVTWSGPC